MDDQFLAYSGTGRAFHGTAVAGLGDTDPAGRVRLDTLARWLQDVAYRDIVDAGLADQGTWIVRRMAVRVTRFPYFSEPCRLTTFCSGLGRLFAERRTTIESEGGARVEASAIWVHLQLDGTPQDLPQGFVDTYGPSAGGRRVRARLHHPTAPPPEATVRPWRFRAAELDLASHVNNAAYWTVLEEELVTAGAAPEPLHAEIEHRAAGPAGDATVHNGGAQHWITDASGTLLATILRTDA